MKKSICNAALVGAVCLAFILISPAYAANWVYVAKNSNGAVFYYDSDTIQRSGNQVTVWEKYDYSSDKTTEKRETRARYRYDCAERTATLVQATNYYPNGNNDTFVLKAYQQEEDAVIPDTAAETMLEAVCR